MVISLCVPAMNRTDDLRLVLPTMIRSANASPPVEIVILDYNSSDGLECYINDVRNEAPLAEGNILRYFRYTKPQYYHMAHARNLVTRLSSGEYFMMLATDALLSEDAIQIIRRLIEEEHYIWMTRYKFYMGNVVCQREEFIAAGGYDERFEFYGPEDRDLNARLGRRGSKHGTLPDHIIDGIDTPKKKKSGNYRLQLNWHEMAELMYVHYRENNANQSLVANEGKEWGQW